MKCCMIISVMSLIFFPLACEVGGVGFTPIKGSWAARQLPCPEGPQSPGLIQWSWEGGQVEQPSLPWFPNPSPISCLPALTYRPLGGGRREAVKMMDKKGRRERWS